MLNNTYALAASPNNLTYTARFHDIDKAIFSVSGLAANASRQMTVSYQSGPRGTTRSLIDMSEVDVDPSSAAGATETSRLYTVLHPSSFKTLAQVKAMFARHIAMISDTTFQEQFFNKEA